MPDKEQTTEELKQKLRVMTADRNLWRDRYRSEARKNVESTPRPEYLENGAHVDWWAKEFGQ